WRAGPRRTGAWPTAASCAKASWRTSSASTPTPSARRCPRSSTISPPAPDGSCNAHAGSRRRSSTVRSCCVTASTRERFPGSCCGAPSRGGREPRATPDVAQSLDAGPLPVTAPLVLNPLMAKMAEAAGFPAGYLGGGATGYQKVALEANLNLTEMCHAAMDIRAVSSLPLILDAACGYGDPMHVHRTIGMSEAAGFAAIEIEDQLVPKRAHHHIGIEHMIPIELMAAKVTEAVAARRARDFVIIARTNAMRASTMDDALRRGEAYRNA